MDIYEMNKVYKMLTSKDGEMRELGSQIVLESVLEYSPGIWKNEGDYKYEIAKEHLARMAYKEGLRMAEKLKEVGAWENLKL